MRPLTEIGWFRGHRAALYWLGILYRRPRQLQDSSGSLSTVQRLCLALKISLHSLPYLMLLSLALRLMYSMLIRPFELKPAGMMGFWESHLVSIVGGIVFGIGVGIVGGIGRALGGALGIGIVGGIVGALVVGLIGALGGALVGVLMVGPGGELVRALLGALGGLGGGLVFGLGLGLGGGLVGTLGVGLGGGLVGTLVVGFGAGIVFGLGIGLSYYPALLRAYYWPLFWWITWPKPLGRFYRYHPVAWDDCCPVPYPGLSRLLVAYAGQERSAAEQEIERLVSRYPGQRKPALRAKTIVVAQDAARVARFAELSAVVSRLPEGERGYLAQTPRLRELVQNLVALASRAETAEVPALRAAEAAELCLRVREVRDQIAGFAEPLASGFLKAAEHWQKLAEALRSEARATAEHAARPQVFRAGDKILDRSSEAFTVRAEVLHELQQQLLLATGCPGIVLYGRRRVGKSSVLYNLQGLLPVSIRSAVISLQNAEAFGSLPGLLGRIHGAVTSALAGTSGSRPASEPPQTLAAFQQLLDRTNQILAHAREKLILALDEYENLDAKIGEGVFGEDLLTCLRESLQSHRNIIWVLAGSHEISELTHAHWASYLVSARTVEVPMFTLQETRALLTDPLKHAPRRPELAEERPRFEPEFWGPQGIESIFQQAGGWPHLVQLLAETLLDLVNRRSLPDVDPALFEEGLDKAIVRGHNVLYQLLQQECQSGAEWDYLSGFRRADTQPPPAQDSVLRALRRRLLVEEVDSAWRLRVPLMQRWLRQRG